MSFFPILEAPDCSGVTTVYNFAPNNWQSSAHKARRLYVCWAASGMWNTCFMCIIPYGQSRSVTSSELKELVPDSASPFLFLSDTECAVMSRQLPKRFTTSSTPVWRATLGLFGNNLCSVSYQGEIDPFPATGTLLSFGFLLQNNLDIDNFLIFINMEESPIERTGSIEIRSLSNPKQLLKSYKIKNNRVNSLYIEPSILKASELLIFCSKNISGVPIFFAKTKDVQGFSLEHTHPPASFAIHGNRTKAQQLLKQIWFAEIDDKI